MSQLAHLVLLKIRPDAPSDEVDGVLAAIRALRAQVEGVLDVQAGADVSVEGLQSGFTHGLVVRFADEAARERYLPHPAHQAVVERLGPLAEGLAIVDVPVA